MVSHGEGDAAAEATPTTVGTSATARVPAASAAARGRFGVRPGDGAWCCASWFVSSTGEPASAGSPPVVGTVRCLPWFSGGRSAAEQFLRGSPAVDWVTRWADSSQHGHRRAGARALRRRRCLRAAGPCGAHRPRDVRRSSRSAPTGSRRRCGAMTRLPRPTRRCKVASCGSRRRWGRRDRDIRAGLPVGRAAGRGRLPALRAQVVRSRELLALGEPERAAYLSARRSSCGEAARSRTWSPGTLRSSRPDVWRSFGWKPRSCASTPRLRTGRHLEVLADGGEHGEGGAAA